MAINPPGRSALGLISAPWLKQRAAGKKSSPRINLFVFGRELFFPRIIQRWPRAGLKAAPRLSRSGGVFSLLRARLGAELAKKLNILKIFEFSRLFTLQRAKARPAPPKAIFTSRPNALLRHFLRRAGGRARRTAQARSFKHLVNSGARKSRRAPRGAKKENSRRAGGKALRAGAQKPQSLSFHGQAPRGARSSWD